MFGCCTFLYMHLQHQLIHVHLVYPSLCSIFVCLSRVSWVWRAHACGVPYKKENIDNVSNSWGYCQNTCQNTASHLTHVFVHCRLRVAENAQKIGTCCCAECLPSFYLICFCYGLIIYVPSYRVSSLESMDVCIYVHLD